MNRSPSLSSDTPAWRFQVWAAFVISLGATSVGIFYLAADGWTRAFLGLGLWFTVSSALSLSKTIRDVHERDKITGRIEEHQAEQIFRDIAKAA